MPTMPTTDTLDEPVQTYTDDLLRNVSLKSLLKEVSEEAPRSSSTPPATERKLVERMVQMGIGDAAAATFSTPEQVESVERSMAVRPEEAAEAAFKDEVVHVQKTTAAERAMLERMEAAAESQRHLHTVSEHTAAAEEKLMSKMEKLGMGTTESSLAVAVAVAGEADAVAPATTVVIREVAPPPLSPRSLKRSDRDFLDLRAWEMEREFVKDPTRLGVVCEALLRHYDCDPLKLVSGILRHADAGDVEVTRKRGSIHVERSERAGVDRTNPSPGIGGGGGGAKRDVGGRCLPHKQVVLTAERERRLQRLQVAFDRVDVGRHGRVAASSFVHALDSDPTVRRLVSTCFGADPVFAKLLKAKLRPLEKTPLLLGDLERISQDLFKKESKAQR